MNRRLTRRQLLLRAGALGTPILAGCSSGPSYDDSAAATWRHDTSPLPDADALRRRLVRYATLAPSSHNTQCWRFRVQADQIVIEPDLARRCPVVDPDDHHLFVSLGCAAENLAQAAVAHGLAAEGRFDARGVGTYAIALTAGPAARSQLFEAIPERQCTRGDYDGQPLSNDDLRTLERAGTGDGVRVMLLTERQATEQVLEYVVAGNTAQMNDPTFVAELTAWIRFSRAEAVQAGDGLFSGASGNPSVPRWLGRALMRALFTVDSENERYVRQIRNSAGIAVFVSEDNDKAHWIQTGRCYQRFALQATALGIRNAFLNQPVEVSTIRPQFGSWLGVGPQRPDLVVRFGRGPTMPRSLRRPVDVVLA